MIALKISVLLQSFLIKTVKNENFKMLGTSITFSGINKMLCTGFTSPVGRLY